MATTTHDTMSAREAARYLRVTQFTLSKLARQGKLPRYRTPGGQVRYKIADLNRLRRP